MWILIKYWVSSTCQELHFICTVSHDCHAVLPKMSKIYWWGNRSTHDHKASNLQSWGLHFWLQRVSLLLPCGNASRSLLLAVIVPFCKMDSLKGSCNVWGWLISYYISWTAVLFHVRFLSSSLLGTACLPSQTSYAEALTPMGWY